MLTLSSTCPVPYRRGVFGELYGVLGIKPSLAECKASFLPSVLPLCTTSIAWQPTIPTKLAPLSWWVFSPEDAESLLPTVLNPVMKPHKGFYLGTFMKKQTQASLKQKEVRVWSKPRPLICTSGSSPIMVALRG